MLRNTPLNVTFIDTSVPVTPAVQATGSIGDVSTSNPTDTVIVGTHTLTRGTDFNDAASLAAALLPFGEVTAVAVADAVNLTAVAVGTLGNAVILALGTNTGSMTVTGAGFLKNGVDPVYKLAATTNFDAIMPEPVTDGAVLKVEVLDVNGMAPTLDLTIQTTDDGGNTWYDVAHLPQLSAPTTDPQWCPVRVAGTFWPIGEVGAFTLGQWDASGLPLLSSMVRLAAVTDGASTWSVKAALLLNAGPTYA